tara:strand:- start:1178 stop:1759 length:582 start_codon:yes stop_codon:yes gene_type:complete
MIDIMDKSFPPLPSQNPLKGKKAYLFDATLRPNTSLRPKGFILLMVAIASVSFFAGMVFIMLGAWPVMGFFSLDVALIYLAFRANYRWARIYETVRLTQDNLLVEKVNSLGKVQRYQFQPYWLRVSIDESAQNDSRLVLASHGKYMRIGSFLSPDERVQLAHALTDALANLRSPEYRKRAYYAVDPEYAGESS